uniref:Uncharacterized protein n=1 Tax=Arundo donax TaxID=35708 RepID=A0A0A9TZ91_ARUDO
MFSMDRTTNNKYTHSCLTDFQATLTRRK